MRLSNVMGRASAEVLESRLLLSQDAGTVGAVNVAGGVAPPEKFVLPIGGRPQVDWAVTAYTDMDPQPVTYRDYRGRDYTIDGNDSLHFGLPDFATMDRGVDVYAAAAGTVVAVHDGEYDRHVGFYEAPPPGTPDNYVLIDHGEGWQTRYGRLRNGSVMVSPGQAVTAGQKIGQVGGSGNPSPGSYSEFGAVLRFKVTHDAQPVETMLDPDAFWHAPLPFAGDVPGVHEMFTSNTQPTTRENAEHISNRRVFHPGERVFTGTKWHGLNRERPRQNRFYQPDGTLAYADPANTTALDGAMILRHSNYLLPADAPLGQWQLSVLLGGVELARTRFTVADWADGLPEIKLFHGDNYIIDGRTTPIDFGTVDPDGAAPWRVFRVVNHGTAPLELADVTLPAGFSLVDGVPATVGAGAAADVVVQLDAEVAGSKGGWVTIRNNDAEQGEFAFRVAGTVNALPAAVVARQVFYDGSAFDSGAGGSDDGAIAPDKLPILNLREFVSFANVTSYTRGINGIMLDVARLPATELQASDFDFWLMDDPYDAATGPAPAPSSVTVRKGAGVNGSDRVVLTWTDGAIRNTWLAGAMRATPATGLAVADGFTFGNLVGDATGDFRVNALDVSAVKRALNTAADLTGRLDFNRDGRVNALDLAAARGNLNGMLSAVPLPPVGAPAPAPARVLAVERVWSETDGEGLP